MTILLPYRTFKYLSNGPGNGREKELFPRDLEWFGLFPLFSRINNFFDFYELTFYIYRPSLGRLPGQRPPRCMITHRGRVK